MEEKAMNIVRFQHPRYNVNRSLFDGIFNSLLEDGPQETHCRNTPATNVFETEKDFRIEVSLPGYDKKEVELKYQKNVLTVKAEHEEKAEDSYNYYHREFGVSSFEKQFKVPESVNAEKISAKFKNGILVITLPKREEAIEKGPLAISIS
ncbi:MAG: Hsp20/alpha crystallin family protein [Chlorobi bacterium]|nr:Hsp20/alpha crystallin family protein [Chlorobiota bacterium]